VEAIDAEACEVYEAVKLVNTQILSNVVIESNNQNVVSAVERGNLARRYWGKLLFVKVMVRCRS